MSSASHGPAYAPWRRPTRRLFQIDQSEKPNYARYTVEWLNYHHLLYFWMVAREGSVAKACEKLSLAQPTISGQLKSLEEMLGHKLFARSGRHLVMTETGRLVYSYAEEIFGAGRELLGALKGLPATRRPAKVVIGVAESLPKLVAHFVLAPVWRLTEPVQVICRDDTPDRLLAELALHELDAVLSDAPVNPSHRVRAFNHLIGESPIAWFGVRALSARFRRHFPESLDGAPVLLPGKNSAVRRGLDDWFEAKGIRPVVRGECEDSALLKTFGQAGHGLFPAPAAIGREIGRQFGVVSLGTIPAVVCQFYVISGERRLKHPGIVAMTEAGRKLFG